MVKRDSINEKESKVTPKSVYLARRRFVAGAATVGAAAWLGNRYGGWRVTGGGRRAGGAAAPSPFGRIRPAGESALSEIKSGGLASLPSNDNAGIKSVAAGQPPTTAPGEPNAFLIPLIRNRRSDRHAFADDKVTPLNISINYNNFYEFGTGKADPARRAGQLTVEPWTVLIDGLCHKPGTYGLEELARIHRLEERIYRLRCVEAWSMVIPWVGFELRKLIELVEPMGSARYVAFQTLYRPSEMPSQDSLFASISYPYVEGLRMDEAMNPLTLVTLGMYGDRLYPQNGAPIKIVVPWKYGFKSPKSVVRISFTEKEPPATWNKSLPREYGFYSNVNPERDHPRWSQRRERRFVGGGGLINTRSMTTEKFNGYGEQVAQMYAGMDLIRRYF